MGWLTEAREQGDRPRHGNYMYGTFGVDFVAGDGARVMVVALTGRQWQALCAATGITDAAVSVATVLGADFTDEAQRYEHREVLAALMRPWFAARTGAEVADGLDAAGVLWSRYRRVSDVVADLAAGRSSAVVVEVDQPGIGQVISARNPLRARGDYGPTAVAEGLGDSTDRVLGEVLGLDAAELARLHDAGVIG